MGLCTWCAAAFQAQHRTRVDPISIVLMSIDTVHFMPPHTQVHVSIQMCWIKLHCQIALFRLGKVWMVLQ